MRKRKPRERRYMVLSISPELLAHFFKEGTIQIKKSPMPKDAEYISTHYDWQTDYFDIIFYHKDFEIVPDGQYIPKYDPNSFVYKRLK